MRGLSVVVSVALLLTACGSSNDQARDAGVSATDAAAPAATATASDSIANADRAAILKTAGLTADGTGQVENECGDKVTPQLKTVDLGASVGRTVLLAMSGGPSSATCYGDGPGLTLFRQTGTAWQQIYSSRGGSLAIMKEAHNGAQDLAFAGPGFSHPLFTWNGTTYVRADREVPDERMEGTTILP